jgi:hypothetical protein
MRDGGACCRAQQMRVSLDRGGGREWEEDPGKEGAGESLKHGWWLRNAT